MYAGGPEASQGNCWMGTHLSEEGSVNRQADVPEAISSKGWINWRVGGYSCVLEQQCWHTGAPKFNTGGFTIRLCSFLKSGIELFI